MMQSEATHEPPMYERDARTVRIMQKALEVLCIEWNIPTPKYKYIRRASSGPYRYLSGLHATVIVNEIEYSSSLASTDWHSGWGSYNDAREAVAGEVMRVLGAISDEPEYEAE
ncbi:hypothetical protein DRE_07499 [Drechslerella stenobrocha 248]|uniref:Uncharacterized protein n=1 Tax=Drechslerella stenobrocha 248 TaxID=1043628 RepID=W7HKH2_9PEZI|nr:hypothetical protein DRE_07499 [Drechslerella stenobrocha 248]